MQRGCQSGFYIPSNDDLVLPKRLSRASSTTTQSGITTVVDATGLQINFVVGSKPVLVHAHCAYVFSVVGTNAAIGEWTITDEANTIKAQQYTYFPIAGIIYDADLYEEITTPGAYVRKVRAARLSGTGTIGFGGADPESISFIQATEVVI